jgi:hypothetical protein
MALWSDLAMWQDNVQPRQGAYDIPSWAIIKALRILKKCHGCDEQDKLDEYGYCVVCNSEMAAMIDELNQENGGEGGF